MEENIEETTVVKVYRLFNKASHFISNLLNVFLTTVKRSPALSRFSFSHLTGGMGRMMDKLMIIQYYYTTLLRNLPFK